MYVENEAAGGVNAYVKCEVVDGEGSADMNMKYESVRDEGRTQTLEIGRDGNSEAEESTSSKVLDVVTLKTETKWETMDTDDDQYSLSLGNNLYEDDTSNEMFSLGNPNIYLSAHTENELFKCNICSTTLVLPW